MAVERQDVGVIDVHTHVFDPALPDFNADARGRVPTVELLAPDLLQVRHEGRPYRRLDARAWSTTDRLRDMDREGIDLQVLSPTPVTLCQDVPSAVAGRLATHQNGFLAQLVADAPQRFRAFGHVPLQAPAAAAKELDRCMTQLGFAGVEVGPQVGDLALSDTALTPFWEAADHFASVVFVHPVDHCVDPRIRRVGAGFGLGMPTETAIAATDLLLGGILDRYPRVRVLLAHGGGSLPAVLPRLAFGQRILPDDGTDVAPVLESARRLWCDSLTYDADSLALAIRRFGAGHVVVGTDYPFAARESPPGAVLADEHLDADVLSGIRHSNATDLLGLKDPADQPQKETP